MTKMLSRVSDPSTEDDEIFQRLVTAPDLLVVCDFEGTLADLCGDGAVPIDGSMRVVSDLAALPKTSVAIIAHDSVAHLRAGGRDGLSDLVTIIERCTVEDLDDDTEASRSFQSPRKDLAVDALLAECSPSLIFFAGDDESDEPVFAALGIDDISCKIGDGATCATMRMRRPVDLIVFLQRVLNQRRAVNKPRRRAATHATA